jgi:hypothetical protein
LLLCLCRSGWYEFTRTASDFNITAADSSVANFTGSVHDAFNTFQATKSTLVAGGNPSLKVSSQAHLRCADNQSLPCPLAVPLRKEN